MDPERPTPSEPSIAAALAGAAPAGWARVELTVKANVLAYDFAAQVRLSDGGSGEIELPAEVTAGFQELRSWMYRPGRGAWFSARLVVEPGREPEFRYNYDEDPKWWPALLPTAFNRDLEHFPRDEAHVPAWLSALLAEGEEFDRHHETQS